MDPFLQVLMEVARPGEMHVNQRQEIFNLKEIKQPNLLPTQHEPSNFPSHPCPFASHLSSIFTTPTVQVNKPGQPVVGVNANLCQQRLKTNRTCETPVPALLLKGPEPGSAHLRNLAHTPRQLLCPRLLWESTGNCAKLR